MPTLSAMISNAIEKLLFHPMTVTRAKTVAGRFRLIEIQGTAFQGVKWVPGQAVQFFLGDLTKRAYTPMDLDSESGSARFLVYMHGNGPGSLWASSVAVGDLCHVMRPKDSLDLSTVKGPAIFFGDETSLAAAQGLHGCTDHSSVHYVFEGNEAAGFAEILGELGISHASFVQRQEDRSHVSELLARLRDDAYATQSPQWIFTGEAKSIQALRKGLKEAGLQLASSKVRAYWSPGKTGMD